MVLPFPKTMFHQQGGLPPLDSVSVMDLFNAFSLLQNIYIIIIIIINIVLFSIALEQTTPALSLLTSQ